VPLDTVERDITRLERWHERRRAQNGSGSEPSGSGAGRPSAVSSSMRR
jgi:hypothetical protein